MRRQLQSEIDKLMQKQMDRKDFLKHVGIGFAGIMGFTSILKILGGLNGQSAPGNGSYGSSAYGGRQATTSVSHGAKPQS